MLAPSRLFRAKWRLRNREESRLIHIQSVLDRWRVVSKPESEIGSVLTNRQSCGCQSCYLEPHLNEVASGDSRTPVIISDSVALCPPLLKRRSCSRGAE